MCFLFLVSAAEFCVCSIDPRIKHGDEGVWLGWIWLLLGLFGWLLMWAGLELVMDGSVIHLAYMFFPSFYIFMYIK
jgi:hypothetical protein